jgi:hypothetical protein
MIPLYWSLHDAMNVEKVGIENGLLLALMQNHFLRSVRNYTLVIHCDAFYVIAVIAVGCCEMYEDE